MKLNLLSFLYLASITIAVGQQTIHGTIMHDDLEREYILYIPEIYSGDEEVPLIFNYHGYTSNAQEQMIYGDFRSIADTAGFIIVHPQGSLLDGVTHWNVGGWTNASTADDVGFTEALLEKLVLEYSINQDKVYATGMSNGGFMSFLLACQLSDKITAIASVTGSMTPETYEDCSPRHPTPIMQIHGTFDFVVPYNGAIWTHPIEETLEYWTNFDQTDQSPIITPIPDINTNDGSTVEHYVFKNGNHGSVVEHFKVSGGAHKWPGSAVQGGGTNYDIDASIEIWKFFSRYTLSELSGSTHTTNIDNKKFSLFPNPTNSILIIDIPTIEDFHYSIYNILGKNLKTGVISSSNPHIDLTNLPDDIYFLQLGDEIHQFLKLD